MNIIHNTQPWFLYIIRCRDNSLYTGITTDVERRLAEHQGTKKGAKYLIGKAPLTIVYQKKLTDRSSALKLEYKIKQLSKSQKENRIASRSKFKGL